MSAAARLMRIVTTHTVHIRTAQHVALMHVFAKPGRSIARRCCPYPHICRRAAHQHIWSAWPQVTIERGVVDADVYLVIAASYVEQLSCVRQAIPSRGSEVGCMRCCEILLCGNKQLCCNPSHPWKGPRLLVASRPINKKGSTCAERSCGGVG